MHQRLGKATIKVRFLGTGDAFNSGGRGSQSLWIEMPGQSPFLADLGPTAPAAMQAARLDAGAVDRVFFTHLHGDHTAGWPFFLLREAFVGRRTRPVRVFGARGTRARLEKLASCCYEDLFAGGNLAFRLEHVELAVARAAGIDGGRGLRFDTVPLVHHPTSLGFRFHCRDRTIAVSGDTRWCPGLEELARDCDLLILECTCLRKPDYAHVSLEEVRAGRDRLGARRIVLTHVTDEVARAFRRRPIPRVAVAEDGWTAAL